MALPDISSTQFVDLIEQSAILPTDREVDVIEKQKKLEMLRLQAADKPHLVNKAAKSSKHYLHERAKPPILFAIDKNNGAAARILLAAGADMKQEYHHTTTRPSESARQFRNAFDHYLDKYHGSRKTDEITPVITEYLEGLTPEDRRAIFGRAADGKFYFLELANVNKNSIIDLDGNEDPSIFEHFVPYGASLDIIPEEKREAALTGILETNMFFGGARYFHFIKEHVYSIEGGDKLWHSIFAPDNFARIVDGARVKGEGGRFRREGKKHRLERRNAFLRTVIDEIAEEDLDALFNNEVRELSDERPNSYYKKPIKNLAAYIIDTRGYKTTTEFSVYLAAKLDHYFEHIYPTLGDDRRKDVDDTCREALAYFYDVHYPNREGNPLYQTLRSRVEIQMERDKELGDYKEPVRLLKAVTGWSIRNRKEVLSELHRERFYPGRYIKSAAERETLLDGIARWDKDMPKEVRGYEYHNLLVQVHRNASRKTNKMKYAKKAAKATKDSAKIAQVNDRFRRYDVYWSNCLSDQRIEFIQKTLGKGNDFRDKVSFAEIEEFFAEFGFYLGNCSKYSRDFISGIDQKCFEDIISYAAENDVSLLDSLRFFEAHYPRQEVLNVEDTLNELSRYIFQPAYIIKARKAGLNDEAISKYLMDNNRSRGEIKKCFFADRSFREIVDNSIYWHMRRAGVVGPAPVDETTGSPITESLRKHALEADWKPLFEGNVDFTYNKKQYRFRAATTAKELQDYGNFCRTCVGGEGFALDCMAGRQQIYGLYEVKPDTGEEKQRGYLRMRVSRSTNPKAFSAQLKAQEDLGERDVLERFADGYGIALNNRTAIQKDYITGYLDQVNAHTQRIFDAGLPVFAKAVLKKGRDGKLALSRKEAEEDEEPVIASLEELLGIDEVTHAESLRMFKLLERTLAAVDRNADGFAVDAESGEVVEQVEGLYEGDRKVRINEGASFFGNYLANRNSVAGYSKMDSLQQFLVYSGLDSQIDKEIERFRSQNEREKNSFNLHQISDVSFTRVEPVSKSERYYTTNREMQGRINQLLQVNGRKPPQLFGNVSIDDVQEALEVFAEAYPEEIKRVPKPYALDETKIHLRIDDHGHYNLKILASHIMAKRGISVPFLKWKTQYDIDYMPDNICWMKDCKPLSDYNGTQSLVHDVVGEEAGVKIFTANGSSKNFMAIRPTSTDDMSLMVNYGQNKRTFPALVWGIPPLPEDIAALPKEEQIREDSGDRRPQWLVTPQFHQELERMGHDMHFSLSEPPKSIKLKKPPIKVGEDRSLELVRPA